MLVESVATEEATLSNYARRGGGRKWVTHSSENVIGPDTSCKELAVWGLQGGGDRYERSDFRSEPLTSHLKGQNEILKMSNDCSFNSL